MKHDGLTFRRFNAEDARGIADQVRDIYELSYVEAMASGNPFRSVDAFMGRFESYSSNPKLDLVMAFVGDVAVGQTWGWPLGAESAWWDGLLMEPEPNFTTEDGRRTFALSEIMVKEPYTGHGYARAMHDKLLGGRPESRATLLTAKENTNAYGKYVRWGWVPVAELRPDWPDAPTFDVLIRDLT